MGERPTQDSLFIGLDVHKATISVAVAHGERDGEVGDVDGLFPTKHQKLTVLCVVELCARPYICSWN